jgi:hypothetical protein
MLLLLRQLKKPAAPPAPTLQKQQAPMIVNPGGLMRR